MNAMSVDDCVIRPVRAEEWAASRELRLTALRDPVAHIAYMDTYEEAVARPDSWWQERTANGARQFVAETADGSWVANAAVLIEEAGTTDWTGSVVARRQGHLVGVYVAPGYRGSGLAKALFGTALEWAWERGAERVRLLVHADNARALGSYRKAGFTETGVTMSLGDGPDDLELELAVERPVPGR